ncbi:uncharacterized protein [Coffea arabica]|uniref:Craniofacial development protein 2-like n=1 Tax=Coffea arabica TaxID=13443 RepID=A0ABM4X6U5_COFAR
MGDLNDITSNREKWVGNLRAEVRCQDFNSFINNNELVDIGFEEVPWTWCHNWGNEGEVKERFDKILGTKEWIRKIDKAKCLHVGTKASDHCMLVLDTNPGGRKCKKRFMFDRRWLLNKDVKEVVGRAWGEHQQGSRLYTVQCKIKKVRMNLLSWSRKSFSNSKKLIEQVKNEIEKVKLNKLSGFRIKLLGLKRKLANAYKKEELFWSQKVRLKWLKEGDKNTGYFHTTVVGRRKANRLRALKRRNGDWCRSAEESREEILDYFEQIFTSDILRNLLKCCKKSHRLSQLR